MELRGELEGGEKRERETNPESTSVTQDDDCMLTCIQLEPTSIKLFLASTLMKTKHDGFLK